jgi:hypothetical protein
MTRSTDRSLKTVGPDLFDRWRPRVREAPALEDERHRSGDQQQT